MTLCRESADTAVDGLTLHYHAGRTAKGVVIHPPPLVERVVSQVVDMNFHQPLLLGTAQDGLLHETLDERGQYRDDVYSHKPMISLTLLKP